MILVSPQLANSLLGPAWRARDPWRPLPPNRH